VTGFVGLSRDITARRTADRERQQLAAAVAVTADGIAITGVSGALEFVNHAFARMYGRKAAELLQTPWASLYEAEEAKRLVQDAIPEVTQVGFWHGEATGVLPDGSTYPQDLSLTLLPHGGMVAVARDISERKAAEERLLRLSVRDELTSLYNRRGFLERAESLLKLSARQGVSCALLYGDLDSFKSVNDCFGHDVGDSALKTTAWILSNTFRDTDLIARLGGDEFTILAINVRPPDIALILERIDQAMVRSNTARAVDPGQAWHLGISLGVAYFDPQRPTDVESLLRSADSAQYEVKRARKAAAGERVLAARG
jgi:diguanylate cyclase (GGDEF)-like protein/PAS domain S-box-containing protein